MSTKKTCFVIIGYGVKPDYLTGRKLDLDKTFKNLIFPVFKSLDIDCYRAIDRNSTGVIDAFMYESILNADIVVADISTLNANVIYELGVRHAFRPFSTIIISEKKIMEKLPFDIDHTIIHSYEHLESDIGYSEVIRFKKHLKKLVENILKQPRKDSPVYTFLPNLEAPKISTPLKSRIAEDKTAKLPSLSELIIPAEKALNDKNFELAGKFYEAALLYDTNNVYLKQKLALVTYYSKKPNEKKALLNADKILASLKPLETTDPETLGLSGAINKRLYQLTGDSTYLDKSLWFYERGYYIRQDYYNGINAAFLYTNRATIRSNRNEAIADYFHANTIRIRVVLICSKLIKDASFTKRDDKIWILQSKAQAHLGLGNDVNFKKTLIEIKKHSKGKFDLDTFNAQNDKLLALMNKFKTTYPDVI